MIRKIFPSRINVSLLCCAMVSEATFTFQIIFRMKNYILSQPSTKKCLLLTIYTIEYKKKCINHKYTTLQIFLFVQINVGIWIKSMEALYPAWQAAVTRAGKIVYPLVTFVTLNCGPALRSKFRLDLLQQ